jgi:hypothetical protein
MCFKLIITAMKKCTVLTLGLLMIGAALRAQPVFGLKAGINLSNVRFSGPQRSDNKFGDYAGILGELSFGKKFLLRPEFIYSLKGWKVPAYNGTAGGSVNLHYISMPILFGYRVLQKGSVLIGPEFGYLLKSIGITKTSVTDLNFYEHFDAGICFGAAYRLKGNLNVEARFIYGFKTLIKFKERFDSGQTGKTKHEGANKALQVGVYYTLARKK